MFETIRIETDARGVARLTLARAAKHFEIHALDDAVSVGRRLASSGTADVVDAHLAVIAESLGTFILTTDPDDMTLLDARFERYA